MLCNAVLTILSSFSIKMLDCVKLCSCCCVAVIIIINGSCSLSLPRGDVGWSANGAFPGNPHFSENGIKN